MAYQEIVAAAQPACCCAIIKKILHSKHRISVNVIIFTDLQVTLRIRFSSFES